MWSDTLALSASRYMKQLDGCAMFEPQIYLSGWQHQFIDEIAVFDDHVRYVMYPERHSWSSTEETVFDWLVDDTRSHHIAKRNILQNEFDSIGIACNCHIHYGQFCIVELGKNIVPKLPPHEDPAIKNGFYFAESEEERKEPAAPTTPTE